MTTNTDRSSSRSNNRKKQSSSPTMKDSAMFPWNWADEARNIQLSPPTTCESPDADSKQSLRRGRPRADSITGLILKGSTSPSAIKCQICNRVFPRDKSLQAHLRTHTGERPYRCDFPGCERAFTQSGQLKTHQRLHTGEKPFVCSAEGCNNSFAHANRHCSDHPFATLHRVQEEMIDTIKTQNENNLEVLKWLEKYQQAKACKQPVKLRDRKLKRELDQQAYLDNMADRPVKITRRDSSEKIISSNRDDEWLGALALIQLAETGDNQPLNLSFQK